MDEHAGAAAILECLGARIAGFGSDRVTARGLAAAKAGIADTVGVTLAGMAEPCTRILRETPGIGDAPGPAAVLGTGRRTSLLDAALINGTASHALDYDDFSDVLGGHQSVPLVAPLLASAAERPLSGRAFVTAYVAGLEVEHRLARAVHPHHYDKGWHPTATLGVFGTVAALANARGLDAAATATALAIAASLASGLKSNFGTMTKPLHVGHAGRSGMMAVLLAEHGFTANRATLEHRQGFLEVFNGAGRFDPAPLVADWLAPLHVELASLGLKQFPCCGSTHQAIAAALRLRTEHAIDTGEIRAVAIGVHPRRLTHTDTAFPGTELEAKFSVQYAVARALLDGAVRLADFRDGAWAAPDVRRLLEVTSVRPLDGGPWDGVVTVTLADGRRLGATVRDKIGRSGEDAMSGAELREKFLDCATGAIGEARAARAFDWLTALEDVADIETLVARDLA